MTESQIIDAVATFYLQSRDFNGIPIPTLATSLGTRVEELLPSLRELVSASKIGVLGSSSGNPHIIRLGFPSVDKQLACLRSEYTDVACAYLLPPHLAPFVTD